jgi:hypothetical protein
MSELSDKKNKKAQLKSTQAFLKISEIKNDTIILKDGTLRAVLAVSSTNFDLKNQDEQNALIFNYQRFLNSLEFPIHILMQSRRMEISDYIQKLKRMMEKQTNELLRIQTSEYIEFVERLVEAANIMNKTFYCIVPLSQSIFPVTGGGFFSKLFGGGEAKQVGERLANFERYKTTLDERVGSTANNLSSIGLRVVRMNTEQLIELVYSSYNFENGPQLSAGSMADISIIK